MTVRSVGRDRPELERRLAIEAHRAVQPEIYIATHRLAQHKYIAAVMAAARRMGLQKLGVTGETD